MNTLNRLTLLPALLWRVLMSASSIALLLTLFIANEGYAQGFSNRLERIGHSSLPGNKIQVTLEFANTLGTIPPSFSTDNPARVVLDFPGVSLGLMDRSVTVGVGAVQQVRAVETNNRVRVVLNLLRMAPFNIDTVGNKVFISVDSISGLPVSQSSGRDPLSTVTQQSASSADAAYYPSATANRTAYNPTPSTSNAPIPLGGSTAMPAGPAIAAIDFRRNDDGAGWVVVELTDPDIVVNMNRGRRDRDVELVFQNTALPDSLDRRLDVTDFATPVNAIDTFMQGANTKMLVTMREGVQFEHFSNRTGREYIIKINEKVLDESQDSGRGLRRKDPVYTGRNVNFNFQDIQVRSALNLLLSPEVSGETFNVVVTDDVNQGDKLSLRLQNVPWDQALDIILEAKGLAKRQFGDNVIIIDTQKNIDAREKEELQAQKEIKELEPVRTQYIQINYAKAEDIATLLQSNVSGSDRAQRFISENGSLSVDERTNTLIIQETASKLEEIRELVEAIDTPARQVLIESRVVIAEDNFAKELGVKFGYSLNQDLVDDNGIIIGGKMQGDTVYSNGTSFTTSNTTAYDNENSNGEENFIVSLPTADPSAALGLALGKVGSYLLQLELSASQTEGTTEILATPKVITANQRQAVILQGERIPYRTVSNGGTQTEFQDAVLKLDVTPQITPDDRIIMDLVVSSDEMGNAVLSTGEPSISKREVQTQVLVDNGETVVLGGVYQQSRLNEVQRVPFFSELPLVGNLFKSTSNDTRKRELLIFVTPKIIRESS